MIPSVFASGETRSPGLSRNTTGSRCRAIERRSCGIPPEATIASARDYLNQSSPDAESAFQGVASFFLSQATSLHSPSVHGAIKWHPPFR